MNTLNNSKVFQKPFLDGLNGAKWDGVPITELPLILEDHFKSISWLVKPFNIPLKLTIPPKEYRDRRIISNIEKELMNFDTSEALIDMQNDLGCDLGWSLSKDLSRIEWNSVLIVFSGSGLKRQYNPRIGCVLEVRFIFSIASFDL